MNDASTTGFPTKRKKKVRHLLHAILNNSMWDKNMNILKIKNGKLERVC